MQFTVSDSARHSVMDHDLEMNTAPAHALDEQDQNNSEPLSPAGTSTHPVGNTLPILGEFPVPRYALGSSVEISPLRRESREACIDRLYIHSLFDATTTECRIIRFLRLVHKIGKILAAFRGVMTSPLGVHPCTYVSRDYLINRRTKKL